MTNKTQAQYLDLVTPGMLRAAQLRSELGAYAASKLSGAYDLITELYGVMHAAADPVPPAVSSLQMIHVAKALESVRGMPVLTSNQCHDLAQALNDVQRAEFQPVPPAGGEPEVLAAMLRYRASNTNNGQFHWGNWSEWREVSIAYAESKIDQTRDSKEAEFQVIELVDRAHVTRLQAEVERLKSVVVDCVSQDAEDQTRIVNLQAELKAMGERYQKDLLLSRERWCYGNRADAKIIALQSELTKARELFRSLRLNADPALFSPGQLAAVDAFIANQSAPADKDGPDDCAHSEANKHGCPECGEEFKSADKGQGEPVSLRGFDPGSPGGDFGCEVEGALLPDGRLRIDKITHTEPTAKPKGEPVAWANWKVGTKSYVPFRTKEEASRSVESSEICATQLGPYRVVPLYAEQPAPVAVILPKRIAADDLNEIAQGWNCCLDAVERLNP